MINFFSQTLASLIVDYATPETAGELSLAMHRLLKSIGEGPFMTRTVSEMIFEGWELDGYIGIIQMFSDLLGVELPPVNIFLFYDIHIVIRI